jgi:hypothetical protein
MPKRNPPPIYRFCPEGWSSYDQEGIGVGLVDALVGALSLDLVYIKLPEII